MKFLTDENIAPQIVQSLRNLGYQIKDVKEENLQGSSDSFLVKKANREGLVIITMDQDFSKLFQKGEIKTGVIFIQHKRQKTKEINGRLLTFLKNKSGDSLKNKLSVV